MEQLNNIVQERKGDKYWEGFTVGFLAGLSFGGLVLVGILQTI